VIVLKLRMWIARAISIMSAGLAVKTLRLRFFMRRLLRETLENELSRMRIKNDQVREHSRIP